MRPKKVILSVDTNDVALGVRTFLLETRGYRVIPCSQQEEALEVLESTEPGRIDLLLCELMMPWMDGNELVRRAKRIHLGLPAMIICAKAAPPNLFCPADAYLPKGACSSAEMIERIRVLAARKRGPKKVPITAFTQKLAG